MKILKLVVLSSLSIFTTNNIAADVVIDGMYNVTDTVYITEIENFDGAFSETININPLETEAESFELEFDSTNSTLHFNDGIGGGTEIVEIYSYFEYWLHAQDQGSMSHVFGVESYADEEATGQFVVNNNMLKTTTTWTDSEGNPPEEEVDALTFMSTTDGDMMIASGADNVVETFLCDSCGPSGEDINITSKEHEAFVAVALKKGTVNLALTDLTGVYSFHASFTGGECYLPTDSSTDLERHHEQCEKLITEKGEESLTITFQGNGSCQVVDFNGYDIETFHFGSEYINTWIDSYGPWSGVGAAASCSYAVSGVDNVVLTYNLDDEDGETVANYKISGAKRYLVGSDQFNSTLPALGEWEFSHGAAWGMKANINPQPSSLTGTYFGFLRADEYTDECLSDGDGDDGTCASNTEPVEIANTKVAIEFDGLGGCSLDSVESYSILKMYGNDYLAATIESFQEEVSSLTCAYVIDSGAIQLDYTFMLHGDMEHGTYAMVLSDDGQTLAASASESEYPVMRGGVLGLGSFRREAGIFIKYDGVVTDEVVDDWFNDVVEGIQGDLGGDNKADILLYSSGLERLFAFEMNGANILTSKGVANIPNWSVVDKSNDFNGDGKADILLRNNTNHALNIFLMNGNIVSSSKGIAKIPGWSISGIADFNGDSKADILLQNDSTGTVVMFLMNGNVILDSSGIANVPDWTVVGTSDHNGDGKADILLYGPVSHKLHLFTMNGTTISNSQGVANIGAWTVSDVSDYTADSKADILLYHPTLDKLHLYTMNGSTISASTAADSLVSYTLEGHTDLDGDNKTDLLVRDSANKLHAWIKDGAATTDTGILSPVSGWSIADLADYDGDGDNDVLLQHDTNDTLHMLRTDGTTILQSKPVGRPIGWRALD